VVCDGVPATKCIDENLTEGSWTWRVRPSIGGWEGTHSATLDRPDSTSSATVPPPEEITVSGPAPPADTPAAEDDKE